MQKEEIVDILKQYNIDNFEIKVLGSFANKVYLVSTGEEKYILKQYLTSSREDVLNRIEILNFLKEKSIHIPETLHNINGEYITTINNNLFQLDIYIPHVELTYKAYNINDDQLIAAGEELAKIHAINTSSFKLKTVNFSSQNEAIQKRIKEFKQRRKSNPNLKIETNNKSDLIYDFIKKTANKRQQFLDSFNSFLFPNSKFVLNHSDFSLTNILPELGSNKLYITDWDGMKLAPRTFEIQRTIGLICGKGQCNGNLDGYSPSRVEPFLKGYNNISKISDDELKMLPEVARYCFYLYWLDFTLKQILIGDFRILQLFPESTETAMFWENNIDNYTSFLQSILF